MDFVKFILISCLIWLASCSGPAINRHPANQELHVVFDLDWTLVSPVENAITGKKIIQVGEESYRLHNGAVELLEKLFKTPGLKVSFFSGGPRERNIELLSKMELFNGNSNAHEMAYKVLSREDLTRLENIPESARFSEKYKKDLTKISSNLENIVMIEDNPYFALNPEHSKSFLHLGETYKYFESYEEAQSAIKKLKNPTKVELSYYPKNWISWKVNYDRLQLIQHSIEEVLNGKNGNLSFRTGLIGKWSQTGLNLRKPNWTLIMNTFDKSVQCEDLLKGVLSL